MADAYWSRYGGSSDGSRQQPPSLNPLPNPNITTSQLAAKRPRSDFEIPNDMSIFYALDDNRTGHHVVRDTDTINESYDRYLRSTQIPFGAESGRSMSSGLPHDDPRSIAMPVSNSLIAAKTRPMEIPLPPDATNTLYVEGLPANCTRREVARILSTSFFLLFLLFCFLPLLWFLDIFRPFVGYKEVRLVSKESRRPGGDPLVLCFVDFQSPAHAATAKDAIQGYEFDEHDRDPVRLRLQFARHPGARSGAGNRGKH